MRAWAGAEDGGRSGQGEGLGQEGHTSYNGGYQAHGGCTFIHVFPASCKCLWRSWRSVPRSSASTTSGPSSPATCSARVASRWRLSPTTARPPRSGALGGLGQRVRVRIRAGLELGLGFLELSRERGMGEHQQTQILAPGCMPSTYSNSAPPCRRGPLHYR